jgi:site-specific recombinase XerD
MTALEQHLDEYLQLRRTLGHKLADAHRLLPRFVTYLDEHDIAFVTLEAALAWSLEREVPVGSVVPAHRMMVVRGFARYLSGIDPRTEGPPAGTIRHPNRWRRPFIYSDADVLAMIEQAAVVIAQPLRSATYQTLIGLLATTGMRVAAAHRPANGEERQRHREGAIGCLKAGGIARSRAEKRAVRPARHWHRARQRTR